MGRRGGPLVQGRGLQPVRAGIVITGLGREQWGSPAPPPPGLGAGAASSSHKPALLYVCVLGGWNDIVKICMKNISYISYIHTYGASQGMLVLKNPPVSAGDIRDKGSIPGLGSGRPLQHSCLENSMDRGIWGLQSMGLQRVRHN